MRNRGRLGHVIVAHQDEHATILGTAGHVGVAEHVAATVDARSLAVPDAEHAVILALAAHLGLLRTPQGGGGDVLVEPGLEFYVERFEEAFRPAELLIQSTQRRTAIAGHISSRVQACPLVALLLHHGDTNKRLGAGEENPFLGEVEPVFQAYVCKLHGASSLESFLSGGSVRLN